MNGKDNNFSPRRRSNAALSVLTNDGALVSTVVRDALIEAAHKRVRQELLEEATRLAPDDEDRAEAAQVLKDMVTLRAW